MLFLEALYLQPPPSWQENQNGEAYNVTNPSISTYSLLVIKPETSPDGDVKEKKPTLAESFEKISKAVEKYDEEQVKGWKEDIDTLLVFAGLFSAVVTAFLIEAYQKLQEDPADKTVTLLEKLVVLQQPNASQTAIISSDSNPFTPDASTIRINCFWLLSLIFSLTSALFGLLCKQWIREYQREPPTRSPGEALALRQLRRDSFDKWGVPGFLSALPILLEIALLLFFAGILDLLWGLHRIPFVVSLVAVGLSAGLYIVTTLLPTLTIPKDQKYDIAHGHFERLSYQFICPYKSPQSRLFYRFVCKVLHPLSKSWFPTYESRHEKPPHGLPVSHHINSPASNWSSFDLQVVRQFDQHVRDRLPWSGKDLFSLQVYQLRAFEWAVTMFRDSPMMIPHLRNILETIPPSVAISAVLGHWDIALWTDASRADVDLAVGDREEFRKQDLWHNYSGYLPYLHNIPDLVICHPIGIKFLFKHQLLMTAAGVHGDDFHAALQWMDVQTVDFCFVAPLSVLGRLWTHQDAGVRKRSLTFLRLYEDSWKSCSSVENDDDFRHLFERVSFTWALAKHINRTDRTSILITSERGREFIRFIHHKIIDQFIYRERVWAYFCCNDWQDAIEKTREAGNLPSDYFTPLPGPRDPPPHIPLLSPIRYSLETEPDIQLGHRNCVPKSLRDGETSDDERILDIQTVVATWTIHSGARRGLPHRQESVDLRLIWTMGLSLENTDAECNSGCSITAIPSTNRTVDVRGDERKLGSATRDHDEKPQSPGKANVDSENLAVARTRKLDESHVVFPEDYQPSPTTTTTPGFRSQDVQPVAHLGEVQSSDEEPVLLPDPSAHYINEQTSNLAPSHATGHHNVYPAPKRHSLAIPRDMAASGPSASYSDEAEGVE
ncbi:hypothetical protein VNI00_010799 [Paramarasmius palmivorus]|uniref:DUF6535 domain-containing protein n=1 Tax=Paramarasmius palmivorus TaxID=297713 RepID=A0AAW0CGA4_9AGAR